MENSSKNHRGKSKITYRPHTLSKSTAEEATIVRESITPPVNMTLQYTLEGHTKRVYIVAWSPDGKRLASGSRDMTARLWDTARGRSLHVLKGHTDWILCIVWSPDGKRLASGSHDMTARLWDTATGRSLHVLKGHTHRVSSLVWSPDGKLLASGSQDMTVRLWDTTTGKVQHILEGHTEAVLYVTWSPDGKWLASGSSDATVRLWDTTTGKVQHILEGHTHRVNSLAWSPNSKLVASGANDGTVRVWDAITGKVQHVLEGHTDTVLCVAWSPNSELVASSSVDRTVRLWDAATGVARQILEGHTSTVWSVAWTSDGNLLASGANNRLSPYDAEVRIWRTDTWEALGVISNLKGSLHAVWHPYLPIVATPGQQDKDFLVLHLDQEHLLQAAPSSEMAYYTNAKVVLVGESGVGKTALSLVLNNQPYKPTDSSHGRSVWTFDHGEVTLPNGRKETRETLLWDLAGQPGYRLLHQLHLNEVTMALVVFDAHNETDPFAGVEYWCRALDQAQSVQGLSPRPLKKILVHARSDRGGIGVSPQRIKEIREKFELDGGYFITSAKEGQGIAELQTAIREGIVWDTLPKVTSTKLFQQIKQFLIIEKQSGRLLATEEELYSTFLKSKDAPERTSELSAQFETCIRLIESVGLIKRLSFGRLVLLQLEMLDAYASALVNSVKNEPDGLGSIAEKRVRDCDFCVPEGERIENREQESLLLIAMIEDLLRRELALREGQFLVFPSQSTRENPDLPDPKGQSVVFIFEGSIYNIYTTLAVRLSHSGLFEKKDLWKNAITYTAKAGGICGLFLHNVGEGKGELSLFFDQRVSEETAFYFEQFVQTHMQRHVVRGNLTRRRLFICDNCYTKQPDHIVQLRRERGFDWLICSVCENRVSLLDSQERLSATSATPIMRMHRVADSQRNSAVLKSSVDGKQATEDFDVFLCYNDADRSAVKRIAEELKRRGILPWFKEWELRPGLPWQRILENQISRIKSAAVFVGKDGIGPWQHQELDSFLREFVDRYCPVIPVIFDYAPAQPQLPVFLRGMRWVDFRSQEPDPMKQLCWGITGKRDVDEEMQED